MSTWQNTMGLTRPSPDASSDALSWAERWNGAACTEIDPDLWFSDHPKDRSKAASYCKTCPLQLECAALGVNESWGIWGGVDRGEPDRARRTADRLARARRDQEAS